MKKVLSFLSALAVAAAAFSCSSSSQNKEKEQSYTAEKLSGAAYKKELLKLPEGTGPVFLLEPMSGGSEYFILAANEDGKLSFLRADPGLESFESADPYDLKTEILYVPCITDDGTLVAFAVHADYGDLPPVEIYSEEYIENQEKYDAAAEYSFMIDKYSVSGELLSSETVKDYSLDAAKDTSLSGLKSDGEYVIADINGTSELFEIGGKYIGELSAGEGETIEAVGRNAGGELVCAVDMGDDKLQVRCVNRSDGTLEKSSTTYNFTETPQQIMPAYDGEYSLYIRTTSSIYGIRSDNGDIDALFSFSGTGVSASNINSFLRHPDGDFIIIENDYTKWTAKVKKFTPCDPSELENVPRITVALANTSTWFGTIEDKVNEWNDENGDIFKVELKNYYGTWDNTDFDAAAEAVRNDALSGNLPDIIYSDIGGQLMLGDVDLLQFDAFCDLYEFMDSDEELSRDRFVPNVLPNLEVNGKLPYISTRFELNLGYVVKSKFYESADEWGVDAYLDYLEQYTDESASKWDRMGNYFWTSWVDTETLECNFNTPQFIRFLKYCDDSDIIQKDYSQVEELTEEETRAINREALYDYVKDREILSYEKIYNYADYAEITRGKFGGEPITILGDIKNPGAVTMSFEGDTFAITKTSQNKELAWEFIKIFFADSELENYQDSRGYRTAGPFPVTKSALKLYENWDRRDKDYAWYKGNPYFEEYPEMEDYHGLTYSSTLYEFEGIPVGYLTDEDVEAVNEMIARAKAKGGSRKDVKLYGEFEWLGAEELTRFFAGECTAEQCAAAMEDRCSTYLAEHYS